jgi:hypothetical protein
MPVRLQGCYAGFTTTPTITSGYALIRLVVPDSYDSMLWDTNTNEWVPCGQVARYDINPTTGCWTSDPVTCNSDLAPPGSYYEISTIINGVCCGVEKVQLDCDTYTYPDPTDVSTVTVITTDPTGPTLICQAVAACIASGTGALSNLVEIGGDEGPVNVSVAPFVPVNFPIDSTLQSCAGVVSVPPTGSAVTFDVVHMPAATVLTTGTVAAGTNIATFSAFPPTLIAAATDWLEVRVTAVGATTPGDELTVHGLITY